MRTSVEDRPLAILLTLGAFGATGVSFIAWALLAFESLLGAPWSPNWLLCGLALPAAGLGAVGTYRTRSPWPFLAGLLSTALPLALWLVLPGPPPLLD
jgi:hypothetical protein